MPPPPPLVASAFQSHVPREHHLNGGHYVDGEFVDTPSTPDASCASVSTQVFGIPIGNLLSYHPKLLLTSSLDPELVGLNVGDPEPTAGKKRAANVNTVTSKQQKKRATTGPLRRSSRLQNTREDENEEITEGGNRSELVIRIPPGRK